MTIATARSEALPANTAPVATRVRCDIDGRPVVDDVTLAPKRGEWLALVGPNGAGKSTLLATLAGVSPPAAGRVTLDERDIARWPPRDRSRQIAWLAQAGDTEGDIDVREVVRLGRLPHHGLLGARGEADDAIVAAAMAEMEIEPLAHRRLSELSGGERQRVLIARALAVQAPTLLLDEPTAHLDAPHQRTLVRSLRARVRAGCAVVTVLHDLTLALQADRVVVLADGRVRADGAPADPALRAAVESAFDHAFAIVDMPAAGPHTCHPANAWPRWVAVALY